MSEAEKAMVVAPKYSRYASVRLRYVCNVGSYSYHVESVVPISPGWAKTCEGSRACSRIVETPTRYIGGSVVVDRKLVGRTKAKARSDAFDASMIAKFSAAVF